MEQRDVIRLTRFLRQRRNPTIRGGEILLTVVIMVTMVLLVIEKFGHTVGLVPELLGMSVRVVQGVRVIAALALLVWICICTLYRRRDAA